MGGVVGVDPGGEGVGEGGDAGAGGAEDVPPAIDGEVGGEAGDDTDGEGGGLRRQPPPDAGGAEDAPTAVDEKVGGEAGDDTEGGCAVNLHPIDCCFICDI